MVPTSLAVPAPAPLVAPGVPIEGLEGLGQRDFVIPRWNLIQPTSQFDGAEQHVGQWRNSITGEFRAVLDVVILSISPSRVLWSGDRSEQHPECTSRDAVTGSEYGACAACQFNPQANRDLAAALRDGQKELKACSYGYTYLVADRETSEVAIIGVRGTSLRAVRPLQTQFLSKRRPTYTAGVRLATRLEKNDRGKFVVLDPQVEAWFEPSEIEPWQALARATRGLGSQEPEVVVEEAHAEPEAAPATPEPPTQPTPRAQAARRAAPVREGDLPF